MSILTDHWRSSQEISLLTLRPVGIRGLLDVVNLARSVPKRSAVVYNYASFAGATRGLPIMNIALMMCMRLRTQNIVLIGHELFPDSKLSLSKAFALSVIHRVCWFLVMACSRSVVVTTLERHRRLQNIPWVHLAPVRSAAVFSNWPQVEWTGNKSRQIAIPGWAHPRVPYGVIVAGAAAAHLDILLVGGRPDSPALSAWTEAGLKARVSISCLPGLSAADASSLLAESAVVLTPQVDGPSTSKGTVAAALFNGCPIVGFRSPTVSPELQSCESIFLSAVDSESLTQCLQSALEHSDRGKIRSISQNAYARHFSVRHTISLLEKQVDSGVSR